MLAAGPKEMCCTSAGRCCSTDLIFQSAGVIHGFNWLQGSPQCNGPFEKHADILVTTTHSPIESEAYRLD